MEVAKLIKEYRFRKGFSQKELARKLKLSEQFLGRVESGKCALPVSQGKKLMKALDIHASDLVSAFTSDYQTKIYAKLYK